MMMNKKDQDEETGMSKEDSGEEIEEDKANLVA